MKRSRSRNILGCFSMATLLLLNVGCETTTASTQLKKLDQAVYIHWGITTAKLVQLLGEPNSSKSLEATYGETELWIYERTLSTRTALEVTRIEENTYWDPFRQRMVTTEIPFAEPKIIINKEVTEILIVDGIVHDWMRFGDTDTQLAGKSR